MGQCALDYVITHFNRKEQAKTFSYIVERLSSSKY